MRVCARGITVLCVVTLRRRTFLIPGARSGNAVNARESVVVAFFLFSSYNELLLRSGY